MSWGSIRSLSNKEIQDIKNNPDLKRRIIPSRNAYRDKNRGADVLKAKCRTVVLGCCDPDLGILNRESPTPTRVSEAVIMQLARADRFEMEAVGRRCFHSLLTGGTKSC